jgi:RNA polymerase sigma-70 factor, ECF subfamily
LELNEEMDLHRDGAHDGSGVLTALERLDPRDQEVLRLTAWEELTPAEAAKVLGVSSVTARSRLHRARRRLRQELERKSL